MPANKSNSSADMGVKAEELAGKSTRAKRRVTAKLAEPVVRKKAAKVAPVEPEGKVAVSIDTPVTDNAVEELAAEIGALKQDIAERDAQVATLLLTLKERDRDVSYLSGLHDGLVERIAGMKDFGGIRSRLGEPVAQPEFSAVSLHGEAGRRVQTIALELYRLPRWLYLLSRARRREKVWGILRKRGLFDAPKYLEAHPDVVAAGVDPLQHYLRHGAAEDRVVPL